MERTSTATGLRSCTLEDILKIVVVIFVEATKRRWFLRTLQLTIHVAVLRTVMCFYPQTAVGPQLSLRAKTMRCLNQRDQHSRPNRTDTGNLA